MLRYRSRMACKAVFVFGFSPPAPGSMTGFERMLARGCLAGREGEKVGEADIDVDESVDSD